MVVILCKVLKLVQYTLVVIQTNRNLMGVGLILINLPVC